jgi:hypothetical protein
MSARNAVAFEATTEEEMRRPGAYQFVIAERDGSPIGINHACPCACGRISFMAFAGHKWASPRDTWTVEGEWPKVTCSPSIGIHPQTNGAYHWHGFLKDGVFKEE